jgi:hypothetical protein
MTVEKDRTERLNTVNYVVLGLIIAYTIAAQNFVLAKPILGKFFDPAFVFATSIGFYNLIMKAAFFLISNVDILLRIYWGKLFLHGFWSYTYTVDSGADAEDKIYFGVWRFEQSLYDTKVVGFGLTDDFRVRSRVRSVSDLLKNGEMYEIVNIRSDSIESAVDNYSRTSMFLELSKSFIFRYPNKIRGKTVVYGGIYSGRVYNTVFTRHIDAKTEEDVIETLRRQIPSFSVLKATKSPRNPRKPKETNV